MHAKFYHNSKCSKSREALKLLNEKGIDVEIIEYLKNPPTVDEIRDIIEMLGGSSDLIVRRNEQVFKENYAGKELSQEDFARALAKNPILIQRPIIVFKGKAAIGRPTEEILSVFK
jgi:arsenate reductase (glutaredoxin)